MIKIIVFYVGIICLPYFTSINLMVEITGFDGAKGNVVLALYRSVDDFPNTKTPFRTITKQIGSRDNGIYTFYNLPKGKYAVAVYQDVNNDNKLDKNILGMPTERYGFSNNARGIFSAPSFKEAQIELDKTKKVCITVY